MNNNFLKTASLPFAVAILGIAGAFTTTSMSSSKVLANQQGHQFISASVPCKEVKMCQTENNGILCRVNDADLSSPVLKGKITPSAASCPVTLYRIQ
ncbi:hypothetical protein ACFPVY_03470 [Flavobacterium qiangtangense]|uniref:DUF2282 domain-containing protein n=1 Tax=Flavobacterium qiangtangense TaxID=1442595 RepID=A0ABW1PJ95_9FLAO